MGAQNALVIQKCVVLFWVEHLEECACRITVDATSDLVHLVDQDKGVLRTHTLEGLNDLTRKGTTLTSECAPKEGRQAYPT